MVERLRLLWWAITGNKHRKHRHDRNGMCLLPGAN